MFSYQPLLDFKLINCMNNSIYISNLYDEYSFS